MTFVDDLFHDFDELFEADLAFVVFVNLLHDLVDLLSRHALPFAVEHFFQSILCYEPRVVHVKVMKGKPQILH